LFLWSDRIRTQDLSGALPWQRRRGSSSALAELSHGFCDLLRSRLLSVPLRFPRFCQASPPCPPASPPSSFRPLLLLSSPHQQRICDEVCCPISLLCGPSFAGSWFDPSLLRRASFRPLQKASFQCAHHRIFQRYVCAHNQWWSSFILVTVRYWV
jgi:hypothetical protein